MYPVGQLRFNEMWLGWLWAAIGEVGGISGVPTVHWLGGRRGGLGHA